MSSYQKLKELALKQTQEKQAALIKEREAKEKDAAAKRAAHEARERARKETERKLVAQKMALRKEQEAKEKARLEAAQKMADTLEPVEGVTRNAKEIITESLKRTPIKGSTQKVDLSHHRPSPNVGSSRSSSKGERRPRSKKDEDDFTGNRADRLLGKEGSSSSSASAKRKPIPLTREEKQQMKRAREFGASALPKSASLARMVSSSNNSPRSSASASASSSPHSSSRNGGVIGKSRLGNFGNGFVALGTQKRDQRSIDEIERDLRRLKEGQGDSKLSKAEIEREAALLRRQKAMEERRRADAEAREKGKKAKDDGDEDLFGSDSEPAPATKAASPLKPERPREPRDSPPIPRKGGINPADFLPGAPLRPEAKARLAQVLSSKAPPPAAKRSHSPAEGSKGTKKIKTSKDTSASVSPAPPKRETARDRFIREEQAKKAAKAQGGGRARTPGGDQSDAETYGYEDEKDEYETEGDEEEEGASTNYRDEIWKMFGKDRKQYASRDIDSDDDMEADASAVLREEMRSAREAREEDLREEEAERKREWEKALRKKAIASKR